MGTLFLPAAQNDQEMQADLQSQLSPSVGRAYSQVYNFDVLEGFTGAMVKQHALNDIANTGEKLSVDQLRKEYTDGLVNFDRPLTRAQAELIRDRKREELQRQDIWQRAEGWATASGVTASLAAGVVDPVGTAVGIVVAPAKGIQMLGGLRAMAASSSLAYRALGTAGLTAVDAAIGNAILEPYNLYSHQQYYADYTMADSLANVVFGGVFGGAFGGGAVILGRGLSHVGKWTPEWLKGKQEATHETSLHTAVAQVLDGRPVQVEPILRSDPNLRMAEGHPVQAAEMAGPRVDEPAPQVDEPAPQVDEPAPQVTAFRTAKGSEYQVTATPKSGDFNAISGKEVPAQVAEMADQRVEEPTAVKTPITADWIAELNARMAALRPTANRRPQSIWRKPEKLYTAAPRLLRDERGLQFFMDDPQLAHLFGDGTSTDPGHNVTAAGLPRESGYNVYVQDFPDGKLATRDVVRTFVRELGLKPSDLRAYTRFTNLSNEPQNWLYHPELRQALIDVGYVGTRHWADYRVGAGYNLETDYRRISVYTLFDAHPGKLYEQGYARGTINSIEDFTTVSGKEVLDQAKQYMEAPRTGAADDVAENFDAEILAMHKDTAEYYEPAAKTRKMMELEKQIEYQQLRLVQEHGDIQVDGLKQADDALSKADDLRAAMVEGMACLLRR